MNTTVYCMQQKGVIDKLMNYVIFPLYLKVACLCRPYMEGLLKNCVILCS